MVGGSVSRFRIVALSVAFAWTVTGAQAQRDDSLYLALGSGEGIATLVDTFATGLYSDPRTQAFFRGVDPVATRQRLAAQFCDVSGGGCKTIDPDMKKTHSGMDIRTSDFDAVISILKSSMVSQGISDEAQARLLEKLLPMRGDIVNTP